MLVTSKRNSTATCYCVIWHAGVLEVLIMSKGSSTETWYCVRLYVGVLEMLIMGKRSSMETKYCVMLYDDLECCKCMWVMLTIAQHSCLCLMTC